MVQAAQTNPCLQDRACQHLADTATSCTWLLPMQNVQQLSNLSALQQLQCKVAFVQCKVAFVQCKAFTADRNLGPSHSCDLAVAGSQCACSVQQQTATL